MFNVDHIRKNSAKYLICLFVFLFPLGMGTVRHWSAGIFLASFVLSFFVIGLKWRCDDPKVRQLFCLFLLLFAVSLLSLINAEDISAGGRRLEKLLFLFYSIPLYLSIKRLKIDLNYPLMLGLTVAGPILLFIAAYSVNLQGLYRAKGFYSAIIFGDMAMLVSLLMFAALCSGSLSGWYKYFGILSFSCGLYASILSGSRGAWIAFPVVVLFLLWMARKQLYSRKKYIVIVILMVLVVIVPNYERIESGLNRNEINLDSYMSGGKFIDTGSVRLMLWQQSIDIWKKHPLIGVGIGDLRIRINENIELGRTNLLRSYGHAHNIFFDTLATTGVFGLVTLVVALFVLPFRLFFSSARSMFPASSNFTSLAGLTLILSFAIFGLTEGWLARSNMLTSYLFLLIVLLSGIPDGEENG